MQLTLHLLNGETIEQVVDKNICTIGRSSKCDIIVTADGISRQHCQIEVSNGEVYVTDLGSTNGTLIDGKKIEAHKRTPFATYLILSFGPVTSLLINLDEQIKPSNTHAHIPVESGFTSTTTKVLPPQTKSAPKAPVKTPSKSAPEKEEKIRNWGMNILALLILLAAVWFYTQEENVTVDDMESAPINNTPIPENF